MKIINQKGFSALDFILGIALVIAIGAAGYFAIINHQSRRETSSRLTTTPTPIRSSSPTPDSLSTITPSGGAPLQFNLPVGWTIDGNNLSTTIDGVQYRIGFQNTGSEDYLTRNYGGDASLIEKVKTKLNSDAYIIKSRGDVNISACLPSGGYGCSMKQNGQFLFISLLPYKKGDQSVEPIDFNSSSAPKAIEALTSIAKSLRL